MFDIHIKPSRTQGRELPSKGQVGRTGTAGVAFWFGMVDPNRWTPERKMDIHPVLRPGTGSARNAGCPDVPNLREMAQRAVAHL